MSAKFYTEGKPEIYSGRTLSPLLYVSLHLMDDDTAIVKGSNGASIGLASRTQDGWECATVLFAQPIHVPNALVIIQ